MGRKREISKINLLNPILFLKHIFLNSMQSARRVCINQFTIIKYLFNFVRGSILSRKTINGPNMIHPCQNKIISSKPQNVPSYFPTSFLEQLRTINRTARCRFERLAGMGIWNNRTWCCRMCS